MDMPPKNSVVIPFSFECTCGGEVTGDDVASYPHEGGVRGEWVYFHCEKCNYDWSWWKIEKRLGKPILKKIGGKNAA